jgi:ATP-binding cassette subfamily B multidrug efflux pump
MALAFWRISSHIHTLDRFAEAFFGPQRPRAGNAVRRAHPARPRPGSAQRAAVLELAAGAADASLRAQKWEAAYEPAVGLTLTAATGLTLGLGGYLVWQSQLTIGALTSFTHVPGPADLADVRGRLGAVADRTRTRRRWRACSRCWMRR